MSRVDPSVYLTPEGRAKARKAAVFLGDPAEGVVCDLLDIIDRLDKPHVIHLREEGWEIQHALACRDDMLGCPVHVACVQFADWDRSEIPPGRYLITVEGGLPYIGEEVGHG
jgi:hypothetical protein